MNFKIVKSGTSKEVTLDRLSRNLKLHSEIYSIQEDGEVYLGVISHKALVLLATEFADYAIKNYAKKEIPEAEACIRLTRKWLEDRESVSNEDLRAAAAAAADADATYAAAYAAANAAYAAANAAYAADAAHAAAAYAAANAANVAADNRDKEFLRQGKFILDFLKSGNHLFSM
jgi:hypothetical protein